MTRRWESDETSIPDWFFEAVETEATEHGVEVDECDVAYRRWGDTDRPALLFIHGMNAHSHWWDFIAPHFLDSHQVVAMDLTGMGDSDYRYSYTGDTYAAEVAAVCVHAGLDATTTLVGHSFGGYIAVKAVNKHPQQFGALVLVDAGIRHPDEEEFERPPMGGRDKVYPDKQSAVERFRLQPPQDCANNYILQYIARHSVMPADGGGWAWKFDADLPSSLTGLERQLDEFTSLPQKLGVIYGEHSKLYSERSAKYLEQLLNRSIPVVAIKDAQHHLFLDQPLAFVAELTKLLNQFNTD